MALLRYNGTLSGLNTGTWLMMSPSTKARVRRGRPKAKSIAVLPRSQMALNLPKMSAATEWIDEDIDMVEVATRGKIKLQKSFTREFKLPVITMICKNAKGREVPAGIRCKL